MTNSRNEIMIESGSSCNTWARRAIIGLASVILSYSASAGAQEIKVFDAPPTVDELRDALGVTHKPRGHTRSIQIDGPSAPAAPAASTSDEPEQRQQSRPSSSSESRHRPSRPAAANNSGKSSGKVAMHIQFDVGSASLRPGAEAFIESIAKILQEEKQYSVTIEGHTDASGQLAKNLSLSMARANTVRDVLVQKYGIDASRLTALGKGPSQPLNPGNPFDPANRRVQFELKS